MSIENPILIQKLLELEETRAEGFSEDGQLRYIGELGRLLKKYCGEADPMAQRVLEMREEDLPPYPRTFNVTTDNPRSRKLSRWMKECIEIVVQFLPPKEIKGVVLHRKERVIEYRGVKSPVRDRTGHPWKMLVALFARQGRWKIDRPKDVGYRYDEEIHHELHRQNKPWASALGVSIFHYDGGTIFVDPKPKRKSKAK